MTNVTVNLVSPTILVRLWSGRHPVLKEPLRRSGEGLYFFLIGIFIVVVAAVLAVHILLQFVWLK